MKRTALRSKYVNVNLRIAFMGFRLFLNGTLPQGKLYVSNIRNANLSDHVNQNKGTYDSDLRMISCEFVDKTGQYLQK